MRFEKKTPLLGPTVGAYSNSETPRPQLLTVVSMVRVVSVHPAVKKTFIVLVYTSVTLTRVAATCGGQVINLNMRLSSKISDKKLVVKSRLRLYTLKIKKA